MRIAFACGVCLIVAASPLFASGKKLIKNEALNAQIEKIAVFEKQEKLTKAQKAYEHLLGSYALTAPQLRTVRRRVEAVNIRMFFSKTETPGSVFYTVKEGERLFDLSKKFKTNMELIKKTNQLKKDELKKGEKLKIIKGTFSIEVDKSDNQLVLFFNKKPMKRYSVTTGANNKTPVGRHKIINKVENPTWYFEDQVIPAGSKKNRLGTRWMGFDKPSYGIHGTVEPEDIGKQASLGCVRMLNRDVEELYLLVPLETPVKITD